MIVHVDLGLLTLQLWGSSLHYEPLNSVQPRQWAPAFTVHVNENDPDTIQAQSQNPGRTS